MIAGFEVGKLYRCIDDYFYFSKNQLLLCIELEPSSLFVSTVYSDGLFQFFIGPLDIYNYFIEIA